MSQVDQDDGGLPGPGAPTPLSALEVWLGTKMKNACEIANSVIELGDEWPHSP